MATSSVVSAVSRYAMSTCSFPFYQLQKHTNRLLNRRWLCAAASSKQSQSSEATTNNASHNSKSSDTDTFSATDGVKSQADTAPSSQEEFTKQIDQLNKELVDFKDKYQRTLADRENVRLRLEKQVSDAKLYGIQGFCKDLLEVSDVFRKALESVSPEQLKSGGDQLSSLYNGLSMTETHMLSVFRRHGLTAMSLEAGSKFDPSWQEAMFEVPLQEGQVAGTVAHVLRTGWRLHDRCIRSAQVGVVKE